MRDKRVEPQEAETYLKQYVETVRGEPARHTKLLLGRRVRSIAAERLLAIDFAARLVGAAYTQLQ